MEMTASHWLFFYKTVNTEMWCELPNRLNLVFFLKVADVIMNFVHVSPTPIVRSSSAQILYRKSGKPQSSCHYIDLEEGLVIM